METELINSPISNNNDTDYQHHSPFIEANTEAVDKSEIEESHIIPVFLSDNTPLISHDTFIDLMVGVTHHAFEGELITEPSIRVSHPKKGRIPSAKGKPADQLEEHEKTLYYERMAFVIQIPSITEEILGDTLCLSVGGVKAYNQDNLNSRKGAPEHFKIFIGFVNKVCTNLCIWNNGGFSETVEVSSSRELESEIYDLVTEFETDRCLNSLHRLQHHELSERQFAQLIGRSRLYQYLPSKQKQELPELLLNDTQISTVAKEYYRNDLFGCNSKGSINLWDLYNLFTESNKSSYIDTFLDRGVNAHQFTSQIADYLEGDSEFWFLN